MCYSVSYFEPMRAFQKRNVLVIGVCFCVGTRVAFSDACPKRSARYCANWRAHSLPWSGSAILRTLLSTTALLRRLLRPRAIVGGFVDRVLGFVTDIQQPDSFASSSASLA